MECMFGLQMASERYFSSAFGPGLTLDLRLKEQSTMKINNGTDRHMQATNGRSICCAHCTALNISELMMLNKCWPRQCNSEFRIHFLSLSRSVKWAVTHGSQKILSVFPRHTNWHSLLLEPYLLQASEQSWRADDINVLDTCPGSQRGTRGRLVLVVRSFK